MPWPARQRTAIFLDLKRRKGEAAAKAFMHRHGYGGGHALKSAGRRKGKR